MTTAVAQMKQAYDLDVVIETPRGTIRRGYGWAVVLPYDYGYIRGTLAPDGEPVDCLIGRDFSSQEVYLIDQVKLGTKVPDEPKVMFAYPDLKHAMIDFLLGYSDNRGPDRIGKVTHYLIDEFKKLLPQWGIPVRKQIHIHYHDGAPTMDAPKKDRYGRMVMDSKWTGTYTANVKGNQKSIEATVEAPDAYVAGDKLRALFEAKYGTDFYNPVARFKGGPKRLDPGSASRMMAMRAGPEED